MSFSADIAIEEQRAVIEIPTSGVSRKGKTVNLENFRVQLADPADSDKLTIAPHEDGSANKFVAQAVAGYTLPAGSTSVGVAVKALADGRPGEGEKDISDDGMLSLKGPDAATFGSPTAATVEDIP